MKLAYEVILIDSTGSERSTGIYQVLDDYSFMMGKNFDGYAYPASSQKLKTVVNIDVSSTKTIPIYYDHSISPKLKLKLIFWDNIADDDKKLFTYHLQTPDASKGPYNTTIRYLFKN